MFFACVENNSLDQQVEAVCIFTAKGNQKTQQRGYTDLCYGKVVGRENEKESRFKFHNLTTSN